MRAQIPSPKSVPLGTNDGRSSWFGRAFEFAHDELEKQQGGFGGLFVFGKVAENAPLFFAAEGRVGHNDIDGVAVANLSQRKAQAVQRIDLRRFKSVQDEIHLRQQIRQRLGLAAKNALSLKNVPILDGLALFFKMLK